MSQEKVLCLLVLIITVGCSYGPQKPNLFYPQEEFWQQAPSKKAERFLENWDIVLQHEKARKSLKARLFLGPQGYRIIDGDELLSLSHRKFVVISHASGGDKNPDGTWNPGCPGSFFQNKLGVWDYLQELRPNIGVIQIHTEENVGCLPISPLLSRWISQTANELDNAELWEFYKMIGIVGWDDVVLANAAQERQRAIREASCSEWTLLMMAQTPFTFLLKDGKPVKKGDEFVFYWSVAPSTWEGAPSLEQVWEEYRGGYYSAKDKRGYRNIPLTESQKQLGLFLAMKMISDLGL